MSITDVATTMRTRFDGEVGGNDAMALEVVVLSAEKRLQVFDSAEHQDKDGAYASNHE